MFYSGKVINANTGEPICGAPVSDGRNTVLTDANGSYGLPGWECSHTVWVGMLTCGHKDWYHFTDGKTGIYDFSVTPWESDKLDLLHISDTEISGDRDVEWVDFLADHAKRLKPAFVMHTGDITRKDGILLHRAVMNFETMGCPVRYVIGNHDYAVGTDPTARYGEQPYEEEAGPVWNSFDCAGIHCVVLSIGKGSKKDMPSGYTSEDQCVWLKNDLEIAGKGKPLVVFRHDPSRDPVNYGMGDIDLKIYGIRAWIYGHAHTNCHHIYDGVHTICTGRAHTGGIDSSPAGIRHITVTAEAVTSEMYYRRFSVEKADSAKWQTRLAGNVLFCEPVLTGEKLLIGTINDDEPDAAGISCLDARSGEVKWFTPVKGNGIYNSFSVSEDRVYCQDSMGNVYCLELETGKVLWRVNTAGSDRTKMAVVLSGDKVLCGKPARPVALDKTTGARVWEFAGEIKKGGNTPARTVVDETHGYTFFCGQWGVLLCVKTATGEEVWRRTEKPLWYRNGTPFADGEYIYAGGFDMLLKLNIHTGETVAECNVGEAARAMGAPVVKTDGDMNVCGGFAVDGDVLYCPTVGSGVVAVDKNDMKVLRRYPAGAAGILTAPYVKKGAQMVESCPVIRGEELIFTALDGKVWFYNKNTAEVIRTINLSAPSAVKPVVTKDGVYTADFDGHICSFKEIQMDMKQIAQRLGIETYPECFDALYRQVAEDKTPACDMVLIAQAQEKYEAFGEYYDKVCSGAEQINADPVCSAWVKTVKIYLEQGGPAEDVPVVEMNGTPGRDMLMLACLIPFIPSAAEKYRKSGFTEEQIAEYMRTYGTSLGSSRLQTGYLGLNATYFCWLNHFAKAEIFRTSGIQFEFSEIKKDVAFLKNRKTGSLVPLITGGMIHSSGRMRLGADGYKDAEGAFEVTFREDAEQYVGHGVCDLVVSREPSVYPKSEWECILRRGGKCLKMHLPRGADLSRENIDNACREAYEIVEKAYPDYIGAPIYCGSWLLDPGLEAFLKPDSRILQFGRRFARYPTESTGRAGRSFVFPGKFDEDADLPENTSLQRGLKQHYLNGGYTYSISGVLIL